MEATWTKLKSGAWGVRVPGPAIEGACITVRKKSGETANVTVREVVWSNGDISLCTVQGKKSTHSSSSSCGVCNRNHVLVPCGYPGCNPPNHCDECDGGGRYCRGY